MFVTIICCFGIDSNLRKIWGRLCDESSVNFYHAARKSTPNFMGDRKLEITKRRNFLG
jgi:hypothetical protein